MFAVLQPRCEIQTKKSIFTHVAGLDFIFGLTVAFWLLVALFLLAPLAVCSSQQTFCMHLPSCSVVGVN